MNIIQFPAFEYIWVETNENGKANNNGSTLLRLFHMKTFANSLCFFHLCKAKDYIYKVLHPWASGFLLLGVIIIFFHSVQWLNDRLIIVWHIFSRIIGYGPIFIPWLMMYNKTSYALWRFSWLRLILRHLFLDK